MARNKVKVWATDIVELEDWEKELKTDKLIGMIHN